MLHVSIARHDGFNIVTGLVNQDLLQLLDGRNYLRQPLFDVQMQIGGNLVVSTPPSVQLAGYRTDFCRQECLNVHMNVFIFNIERQFALLQLFIKRLQSFGDGIGVGSVKDLGCLKHLDMGQ